MKKDKGILLMKCDCGCGYQIQFSDLGDGDIDIDLRKDGRCSWSGVNLKPESVRKLVSFLKDISKSRK